MPYQRAVLKVSGELLCAPGELGTAPEAVVPLAEEIAEAHRAGCTLAVVVGAGNLVRGKDLEALGFDRVRADQTGMVATVLNGLALEASLRKLGVRVKLFSAFAVGSFVAHYEPQAARELFEEGSAILLSGGTGNALVTTDTAAALRAGELGAEVVLKGTKVDGVYSADPRACPEAKKYDRITYAEVLEKQLGFMDAAAVAICREHGVPIRVFSMRPLSNLLRAVRGEEIGTLVWSGEDGS